MLRARVRQKTESSSILPSNSLLLDEVYDGGDVSDRSSSKRRPLTARRTRMSRWSLWNTSSTTRSPFLLIIGCLCFAVSFEIGYILSIGAFSDGEVWNFFFGPTTTSATFNDRYANIIRVPGNVPPLDNYYSRPHIRDPVPLIVGGSDGSGTRAFVMLLEHLNVPILVEDRGTMDVHGSEMYDGAGWPALVSRVLNVTRSASYDLEEIPDPIRQSAKTEIGKFLKSVKAAGRGMVSARIDTTWATSVSWAFKAPVSILLLPFFRDQLPAIKVLHIVRDGRDVALSDNHSPVQKFYADFYPDAEARHKAFLQHEEFGKDARTHIKAMQLWNDWNKEVYEYGVRYSDGETLEVLVMRTEDLLHYPLERVALLADFVGSPKTSQQLCCLSRMSSTDLGKSGPANPLEELVEAGEEEGAAGLRGPRMFDPQDFDNIRKRFKAFVPDAPGRRLMGEPLGNDDKGDLFKSGGKIASAHHPVNDLNMNAAGLQQRGAMGMVSPVFNHVARMQQLIREKHSTAKIAPKIPQAQEEVKLRYGKWMQALREDPALSTHFRKDGREALSLFGYEPPREFMDIHPHPELLSICGATLVCPS
jgi:hypothetical protein